MSESPAHKSGTQWIIDTVKSNESVLYVNYNDNDCADREHNAFVKSDGCIELGICEGVDSDGVQITQVHLCELNDFIQALEELRDVAKKHFGGDWL